MNVERTKQRIEASITIDANGCWIWGKSRHYNGYGSFALGGGRRALAHRVSYTVFVGDIPATLLVCHTCDVPACVNPSHLFCGTQKQNMADAARKGRTSKKNKVRGASHHAAKLNDAKVAEILLMLNAGVPKVTIARRYGVTDRVILLIARGDAWNHVPRPAA